MLLERFQKSNWTEREDAVDDAEWRRLRRLSALHRTTRQKISKRFQFIFDCRRESRCPFYPDYGRRTSLLVSHGQIVHRYANYNWYRTYSFWKGPSSLAMGLHQRENFVANSDEFSKVISLPDAIDYKENERPSFRTGNGPAQSRRGHRDGNEGLDCHLCLSRCR